MLIDAEIGRTRMVLVTGATGNIGRVLVRRLADRGIATRALTRDASRVSAPAGVEVAEGDMAEPESVRSAMDGVRAMFLNAAGDPAGVLRVARESGVRHVVLVSSVLADVAPESYIGRGALAAERTVRESGLEWTVLRPGEFASNALSWAPAIRESGVVQGVGGDLGSAVIDPADIAAVAELVLTEPGHAGVIHPLTGPELVSPRERTAALARVLGRDVRFEEQTETAALAEMKQYMPAEMAESFLTIPRDRPGVLSTVPELTGVPGRTFRQWAQEHAAAFE